MDSQVKRTIVFELSEDDAYDLLPLLDNWNANGDTSVYPDTTRLAIGLLDVLNNFF